MALSKCEKRNRIRRRIRKKISGTSQRPRLSVFRSNKDIYVQVIDDEKGVVLASQTSFKNKSCESKTKIEQAQIVGKSIAQVAIEKKIEMCVFDRGGYLYHGRIKALAEAAREGGLKF